MIRLNGNRWIEKTVILTWLAMIAFSAAPGAGAAQNAFVAIGCPMETVSGFEKAGSVYVLYSGNAGLADTGNHCFTQDSPEAEDTCEEEDYFGNHMTTGDFNGDGLSDLAIGIPDEDIGGVENAGAVQIFYAAEDGVTCTGVADQFIESEMLPDLYPTEDKWLGYAVAASDFNNDGYDDLAVGIPGQSGLETIYAGVVIIFNGSGSGLDIDEYDWFWQDTEGISGAAEAYDRFGSSLATGDINQDGFGDLVVGVPYESIGDVERAGCIHVIYGSSSGLTTAGNQIFWQGQNNVIKEIAELNDYFGDNIVTGDFNNDGFDDIAIAAPGEKLGLDNEPNAGAVSVLLGSASGITTDGDLFCSISNPAADDWMGCGLAAGDINADGFDDLIVGAPGRSGASFEERSAGEIYVYFGNIYGVSELSPEPHYQGDGIIPDSRESFDRFGYAIACADLDNDGFADIVVGAPEEDIETPTLINKAGMVIAVYGSASGLSPVGAQIWTQNTGSIAGEAEPYDCFGWRLAVGKGNFNAESCNETGVELWMPAHSYVPGDPCACIATVCNAGSAPLIDYPLFVILDLLGNYYFAPSFSGYDNYSDRYAQFGAGETQVDVLPQFNWPQNSGSISGCMLYGALTDPAVTQLYGEMDSWFFSWTE